jgi:hypothetical protein
MMRQAPTIGATYRGRARAKGKVMGAAGSDQPGLPQVGRLETLGEPAVAWGKKITGFLPFALIAPQLGQGVADDLAF